MRRQVLLTQALPTGLDGKREGKLEREKERERKEEILKRGSNFSLNFPVIGPSVSGEARSKVAPAFVEFRRLQEVGVFSY